jgi:GT2 family glycosyltransferase
VGRRANVYVIDNGSIDGSLEYVKKCFPSVRLITFSRNLGFAAAYNEAVRQVDEDIVIFLNNDVEVAGNWFDPLVEPIESGSDQQVAICGSKILLYYDRCRVNHAGGVLLPVGGGIDIDFLKPDKGEPTRPQFVGSACGASMAVKRGIFLDLGGFDEDFFAYFEDVDFCWRAWLAGYKVMLVPASILYHKFGSTSGPYLNPKRVYVGERNRVQSLLKNLETRNVLVGIFVSGVYSIIRILRYLWFGEARPVFATVKANWWVLRNIRLILKKRHLVQSRRVIPDRFLFSHGLMASYYQGLREFARLTTARQKYLSRE